MIEADLLARMTALHGERRAREAYRRGLLLSVIALQEAATERKELAREAMREALEHFYAAEEDERSAFAMLGSFADDVDEGPGLYRSLFPSSAAPELNVRRVSYVGNDGEERLIEFR